MASTSERLPWLTDEPSGGSGATVRKKSAGRMWPWYLLLLLLVGGVLAGAFWLLNNGKDAAPPELPAEQSLPIPVTQPAAPLPATDEQVPGTAEPDAATQSPVVQRQSAAPFRRAERPQPADNVAAETADDETGFGRSIFPADDVVAAPPPTGPNPVAAYNPRPYGGRVVQLGAFPTRKQAEAVWARVTRRYPYLATRTKMVNAVDVRGLGGGRPTRMYRLQLGTSSQAQSVVICQQLERAGHSCVVVY